MIADGKIRVRANVGLTGLRAGRWHDVDADDPRLPGWESAGLVSRTGPRGEQPPDEIRAVCCGR